MVFHWRQQAHHIASELLGWSLLRCGAHDQPVSLGSDLVDDLAQATPFVVAQALGDPKGERVGDEHGEASGQRHLLGEAGALGADRVLRDLAQDDLAGAQHLFDPGPSSAREAPSTSSTS